MNAQRPSSKLNVQFTTDARYQEFLAGLTEREVLGIASAGGKSGKHYTW